jgi:hypothetical protein
MVLAGNHCLPGGLQLRELKGFEQEKSSISDSDRCHHRCHCLGDTITSSGVAGWLGSRSRRRTHCRCGDWWNSDHRLWPGLRLLRRTGVRLLWRVCPCLLWRVRPGVRLRSRILRRLWIPRCSPRIRILRPSVLSRVSLRLVMARWRSRHAWCASSLALLALLIPWASAPRSIWN